jgi:transmembrane sensor
MSMTDSPTDAELAAYVAGQLPKSRTLEIDRWIAGDTDAALRVNAIRALVAAPTQPFTESWDRARMWSNVRRTIDEHAAPRTSSRNVEVPETQRSSALRWRMVVAGRVAAVVVVAATGLLYYLHATPLGRFVLPFVSRAREYTARRGERATIQLADGSRVILAPESRLRVSAAFGRRERAVELQGEAEFDVVHDTTRAFTVRAGRARVVDVGTRFDLRAYPDDSIVRVAVAEGAVSIGSAFSASRSSAGSRASAGSRVGAVMVRHGEVAHLAANGRAEAEPMDAEAPYFAWTQGKLEFDRAPLRDVLATITRWFDVDVRVADDAMGRRLVTAEFSTRSPQEMIRALAHAVDASVAGTGPDFILVPR